MKKISGIIVPEYIKNSYAIYLADTFYFDEIPTMSIELYTNMHKEEAYGFVAEELKL